LPRRIPPTNITTKDFDTILAFSQINRKHG
jgi:hypothetical protein